MKVVIILIIIILIITTATATRTIATATRTTPNLNPSVTKIKTHLQNQSGQNLNWHIMKRHTHLIFKLVKIS